MSDATTPYLNQAPRSAERRALEIAVKALRKIRAETRGHAVEQMASMRDHAHDALCDIQTLVPDAGEPE